MLRLSFYGLIIALTLGSPCFSAEDSPVPQWQKDIESAKKKPGADIHLHVPTSLDLGSIETYTPEVDIFYFETPEAVCRFADAIVVGKPLQAFLVRDAFLNYEEPIPEAGLGPELQFASTTGPFAIQRVLYRNPRLGTTTLQVGQTITVRDHVGLFVNSDGQWMRFTLGRFGEIKQNSQYVLFLVKGTAMWGICNAECGRFNTDGTDTEDDLTGRAAKALWREWLTKTYGVTFVVPSTKAPHTVGIAPLRSRANGTGFLVTVQGRDFKNGASIHIGGSARRTTFLSASRLSAVISAEEKEQGAKLSVFVVNPDEQKSESIGLVPR